MSLRTLIEDTGYALSNAKADFRDGWNGSDRTTRRIVVLGILLGALMLAAGWTARGWLTSPSFELTAEEQALLGKARQKQQRPPHSVHSLRVPWSDDWPGE